MVLNSFRCLAKRALEDDTHTSDSNTAKGKTPSRVKECPITALKTPTTSCPSPSRIIMRDSCSPNETGEISPFIAATVDQDDVFASSIITTAQSLDSAPNTFSFQSTNQTVPDPKSKPEISPATHTPKSLKDLPPELRLRIYQHLFKRQPIPSDYHCCSHPPLPSHNLAEKPAIQCHCVSGPNQPQILSVCKAFFKEALPILYIDIELHITLPPPNTNMSHNHILATLIPPIPASATPYIKNAVFVHPREDSSSAITPSKNLSQARDEWKQFWPSVWTHFRRLQNVRVHLDIDEHDAILEGGEGFDFESFRGLVNLGELRRVVVELHVRDEFMCLGWQVKRLAGFMKVYLEREAKLVGMGVEVRVELMWVHVDSDGRLRNWRL